MVSDGYPPVIGGLEQYVQRLSHELTRRGHEVGVATLRPPALTPLEQDACGVTVHRMRGLVQAYSGAYTDPNRPFAPPLPDPGAVWALRDILRRGAWDIVHCHNWLIDSYLPLRAFSRASVLLTLHDYSLVCAKKTLMFGDSVCSGADVPKCVRCALRFFGPVRGLPTVIGNWSMQLPIRLGVDLFLPVSRAVACGNRLPQRRLPFRIIPNFVGDDGDSPPQAAGIDDYLPQLPTGEFLLFVGGLDRSKGVDVLLQAYAGLQSSVPLVIIGATRPDTIPPLPANVTLLRDWPVAAVRAAWRRSLLGLVPSVWPEPCPTVALEAMAEGRPIIASRIGGLPDLVLDGETGLLVPPRDALALRSALERLLTDNKLREAMGHAARARAESFRASTVVPRIEQAYLEVRELRCRVA
jgi:glycosyltransferase involved in cell wall biosynthesis